MCGADRRDRRHHWQKGVGAARDGAAHSGAAADRAGQPAAQAAAGGGHGRSERHRAVASDSDWSHQPARLARPGTATGGPLRSRDRAAPARRGGQGGDTASDVPLDESGAGGGLEGHSEEGGGLCGSGPLSADQRGSGHRSQPHLQAAARDGGGAEGGGSRAYRAGSRQQRHQRPYACDAQLPPRAVAGRPPSPHPSLYPPRAARRASPSRPAVFSQSAALRLPGGAEEGAAVVEARGLLVHAGRDVERHRRAERTARGAVAARAAAHPVPGAVLSHRPYISSRRAAVWTTGLRSVERAQASTTLLYSCMFSWLQPLHLPPASHLPLVLLLPSAAPCCACAQARLLLPAR